MTAEPSPPGDPPASERHGHDERHDHYERHVSYVHGFDPEGPDKYAAMLKTGAVRWARWHDTTLDVEGPDLVAPHVTRLVLTASPDGERPVRCTLDILAWDDIVREHWTDRATAIRARAAWCFCRTLLSGTLTWLWLWSWPTLITAALPGATTLTQIVGVLASLAILVAVVIGALGWGWLIVPAIVGILVWFARRFEARNNWAWAGRFIDFAWTSVPADPLAAGPSPTRHDVFVDWVARQAAADDRVVIGHSGGAQEAVAIVDAVMARPDVTRPDMARPDVARPPLLLTLGTLVPLVSLQRGARWLQDAIGRLASHAGTRWVDVSSPPDPACVAIVDPVEATFGTSAMGPRFRGPRMVNARFHANVPAKRYERAQRDRIHMHFLYLRPIPATQRAGDYDLYAMLLRHGPAEEGLGPHVERPPFARAARHGGVAGLR